MDVKLDLSMRNARVLEGCSLRDYQEEYQCVLQTLTDGLEAHLIDGDRWYKDSQYLYFEDSWLQWAEHRSGQTGCNRSVDFFRECLYSEPSFPELQSRTKPILDSCGCHASKQSNPYDQGLISSLPIPYCATSLLYLDFIHGLPRMGGYDTCVVVTCGLSLFTRALPCSKKITGEQSVKNVVKQQFEHYGAPKDVHSDEDVCIRSDVGWYRRVLDAHNV